MVLCANRPTIPGSYTNKNDGTYASTCTCQVILVPLATWVLIFATLLSIPHVYFVRRARTRRGEMVEPDKTTATRLSKNKLQVALTVLYCFLVVAMLAMVILQISRLVASGRGVGLLPASIAGVLLAGALHWYEKGPGMRALPIGFWVIFIIMTAVEISSVSREYPLWTPASEANYMASDEIIDTSVMLGVAVVLTVLEFFT